MRIALVTNILPPQGRGGAEAYAALEAATLSHDHEVLVLSGSKSGDIGDARLTALPHLVDVSPVAGLPRKLEWHARDQWRPSVHLAVRRALREFKPDVIHTHAVQGLSAAVFTAIGRSNVPHVHTAHDLSLLCARTTMTRDSEFCGGGCAMCRIQRAVRGGAIRGRVSTFVAVSTYILDRHVAAGIAPPEDALVLRLGARTEEQRVRRLVGSTINVGFLGALAPHKGVRTLLDVFREAPEGWHLTIGGAGALESEVAAAAAGHPGKITFVGHVSGEAKERFFDVVDALVIPSEWEEPAALVGTEALARAIPLIVSDRGGLPELAEARVFRSRDAADLRRSIAWMTADPARFEATSERLFERHRDFSWTTHLAALTEILRAAAERRQAGQISS